MIFPVHPPANLFSTHLISTNLLCYPSTLCHHRYCGWLSPARYAGPIRPLFRGLTSSCFALHTIRCLCSCRCYCRCHCLCCCCCCCIRIQRIKDTEALLRWITCAYWVQLALVFVLFFTLIGPLTFWPAFCASTMHPLSRYPVFVMGMLGGELAVRYHHQQQHHLPCNDSHRHEDRAIGDRDRAKSLSVMPWTRLTLFRLFPLPCTPLRNCCMTTSSSSSSSSSESWSHRAISQSIRLLLLTIGVIILGIWTPVPPNDPMALFWIKVGAVWWQAVVPFAQLEVILALGQSSSPSQQSGDHDRAEASASLTTPPTTTTTTTTAVLHRYLVLFLCHPYLQLLGQWSMNIYLVHWLVLKYVTWGVNRHFVPLPWPESFSCDENR